MSDLKLTWNEWGADATVEGHDLVLEDGLATAVILSLFLDARARADDALPDGGTDLRGFWADTVAPAAERDRTGSRLWLLSREKTLPGVLRRAHDYAADAPVACRRRRRKPRRRLGDHAAPRPPFPCREHHARHRRILDIRLFLPVGVTHAFQPPPS